MSNAQTFSLLSAMLSVGMYTTSLSSKKKAWDYTVNFNLLSMIGIFINKVITFAFHDRCLYTPSDNFYAYSKGLDPANKAKAVTGRERTLHTLAIILKLHHLIVSDVSTSLIPRPKWAWFPLFTHARSNCESVRNRVSKCIRERSKPRSQESYGDSVGVLEADD